MAVTGFILEIFTHGVCSYGPPSPHIDGEYSGAHGWTCTYTLFSLYALL